MIRANAIYCWTWFVFNALIVVTIAQDNEIEKKPLQSEQSSSGAPAGLEEYLGRKVAMPMSYHGIWWLNRPERMKEERPSEMLDQLKLAKGMTVCDMGSGDGFYSVKLAKAVGETGKVYAVDIQREMLEQLEINVAKARLKNVDPILGELWDPKLPANSLDLILMVDVYHEFSHPIQMLASMRIALKDTGLIALVEFRGEDPTVPILPEHKMTKEQIGKEYSANGYRIAREYNKLPWQHLIFLEKDPEWKGPKEVGTKP